MVVMSNHTSVIFCVLIHSLAGCAVGESTDAPLAVTAHHDHPTPALPFVYVANTGDGTISKIEVSTRRVVSLLASDAAPSGMNVSPDSQLLFVASVGANSLTSFVVADDSLDGRQPVGRNPQSVLVVLTPNGPRTYTVNQGSHSVFVLDEQAAHVATIPTQRRPSGIAASPDGLRVFIANEGSDSVTVIDTRTNTVVTHIAVGDDPVSLAVSPDGHLVYALNHGSEDISVIDTTTNTVVSTLCTGEHPRTLIVDPAGAIAYVSRARDKVSRIELDTATELGELRVGGHPDGLALTPGGDELYVANTLDDTVSVVDTASHAVVHTIHVGARPTSVAATPF